MTAFTVTFILITISVVSLSQAKHLECHPETNPCAKGSYCRLVKDCGAPQCRAAPRCVSCVPDGVDMVCNAKGYIRAVLVNKTPLTPLYCNPMLNNDINGCPFGSVCASNDKLDVVGTCCYGKPEHCKASNDDARCDTCNTLCGGKCKRGYECKPSMSECGTLKYSCQPIKKPGRCPPVKPLPPKKTGFCDTVKVARFCEIDYDCSGAKKCCDTICGGKACNLHGNLNEE